MAFARTSYGFSWTRTVASLEDGKSSGNSARGLSGAGMYSDPSDDRVAFALRPPYRCGLGGGDSLAASGGGGGGILTRIDGEAGGVSRLAFGAALRLY